MSVDNSYFLLAEERFAEKRTHENIASQIPLEIQVLCPLVLCDIHFSDILKELSL